MFLAFIGFSSSTNLAVGSPSPLEKAKDIHAVCGKKSGRDVNKTEQTGLTPIFADNTVYFAEARLTLICKKQYCAPFVEEGFIDREVLERNYNGDLHNLIIGKIEKVLVR